MPPSPAPAGAASPSHRCCATLQATGASAGLLRRLEDVIVTASLQLLCTAGVACFGGLVWLTHLLQAPLKLQLDTVTKFVDDYDEKRWKPMMAEMKKNDDRVATMLKKTDDRVATMLKKTDDRVATIQTVGATLLGVGAAWWLWRLAEVAGVRRSLPRAPPPA
jgi:hypothetical protein